MGSAGVPGTGLGSLPRVRLVCVNCRGLKGAGVCSGWDALRKGRHSVTGFVDTSLEGGQTRGRPRLSREAAALSSGRAGAVGPTSWDRTHVLCVQTWPQSGLVSGSHRALSDAGVM